MFTVSVDGIARSPHDAVLRRSPLGGARHSRVRRGVRYGLDLTSTSTIDLDISLGGTVQLDEAGRDSAPRYGPARDADRTTPTLSGGIGIAEATVASALDARRLDRVRLRTATADTPVVTTASATLGNVTIAGLGVGGADISVSGRRRCSSITWPTLPSPGVETAVVDDGGWTDGGLQQLANVSINDLLGAPGGVASWLSAAQTLGTLATPLPVVPDTLGDSIGVAQSLATVHDQVAAATAVAFGPLATTPAPRLSPDLCADLCRPPSARRSRRGDREPRRSRGRRRHPDDPGDPGPSSRT